MTRDWRLIEVPYFRIDEASDVLARAFATDRLIAQFVPLDTPDRGAVLRQFFKAACMSRLSASQPLMAAEWDNKLAGVACVKTTYDPPETETMKRAWQKVMDAVGPVGVGKMEQYLEMRKRNLPPRKHYYLHTIGVDPNFQNMGFGRALLECVVAAAQKDPTAAGVLLDTDGEKNLVFYERCGFTVTGRESLGGVDMLYMYKAVR